jgi:hypothetical protein
MVTMAEIFDLFDGAGAQGTPETEYRPCRPSTAQQPSLFLVFRSRDYLILHYADLEDIGNPPGVEPNDVVRLRFRGKFTKEVRIEGRRLLDVVRPLWQQQVAWLKETPEEWDGPLDGSIPVITRITVLPAAGNP